MTFDPSKSNIPAEYNFAQPLSIPALVTPQPSDADPHPEPEAAVVDAGTYTEFDPAMGHMRDSYWRRPAPEGSFTVRNAIAQRTRLTPLRVPEYGAGSGSRNPVARFLNPFPKEEYYAVEMEHDYGREWPRLVVEEGALTLRPGFLGPAVDPDFAPYWLHRGLARFTFSTADRLLQTLLGGLYIAALCAAAAALAASNPHLLACLTVSWATRSLSLAAGAGIALLAATDRLFLFWVLLAGAAADRVLAKHAPGLRSFAWGNLAVWGIYLALSPTSWPLLPLPGFMG